MNSTLTEQSPTTAADAPPARRRLVGVLVWACWAIMTAAALGYVARYGTNVPSWDDWDMVPTMTGHQPLTPGWLWSQHNEHRVPVPRLLMLALFRVLGNDFRVLMVANVAMMSGLAAALMVVARRLRGGRANLTDAFFPLLLLNWAQGLNFVWGWQVEFYVSTLLAGVVLLLVATMGPRLTVARAALITGVLWLLMMCGAHGVVLLPAMGSWLGLMAILRWFEQRGRPAENLPTGGGIGDLARGFAGPGARGERVAKPQTTTDTAGHVQDSLGRAGRGPNRREALVIALLALSVFVAAGLYFIGYEQVPYHPKGSGRRAQARTALQFLTMSFGRSVQPAWPVSGWLAMALFVATVVMLLYLVWKRPTWRQWALGVGCFGGAMACLALAIGMGRNGFEDRYITLSVPVMCAAYLAWVPHGGKWGRAVVPGALLLATLACLVPNTRAGIEYGREITKELRGVERDIDAGKTLPDLIARYHRWLALHSDLIYEYSLMLRGAGVGAFARLRDDPPLREVRLRPEDARVYQLHWTPHPDGSATAVAPGWAGRIDYDVPGGPTYVRGLRVRYRIKPDDDGGSWVALRWQLDGKPSLWENVNFQPFSPTGDRLHWESITYGRAGDDHVSLTAWICDTVDTVCFAPGAKPGTCEVLEMTLLLPQDAPAPPTTTTPATPPR